MYIVKNIVYVLNAMISKRLVCHCVRFTKCKQCKKWFDSITRSQYDRAATIGSRAKSGHWHIDCRNEANHMSTTSIGVSPRPLMIVASEPYNRFVPATNCAQFPGVSERHIRSFELYATKGPGTYSNQRWTYTIPNEHYRARH